MEKNYSYWVECEYGFVDKSWDPCMELDWEQVFNRFIDETRKPLYKELKEHGKFVPEWLANMVEFNTKPWKLNDVIEHTTVLHQITEEIAKSLWLVISDKQPPFPQNYSRPVPTNPQKDRVSKNYWWSEFSDYVNNLINTLEDCEEYLWYCAGTTSLHMHFFWWDNNTTFDLRPEIAIKISQEMQDNPEWYLKYNMSKERFKNRSKLVETRKKLVWDVVSSLKEPIEIKWDKRQFVMERFFKKNGIILNPSDFWHNLQPNRDHRWFSIKQPANWIYTLEARLSDWPWNDINKISQFVNHNNSLIMEVLENNVQYEKKAY